MAQGGLLVEEVVAFWQGENLLRGERGHRKRDAKRNLKGST